ncbi:MAG TPA: hypothetical protein PKY03_08530 [Moraxellaceae bacterium]|nr:hypothetical protein [Moraxellaceae bacterium]
MGLRYGDAKWSLDASMSWRDRGGPATSDTTDRNPSVWVTTGWKF